MQNQGQFQNKKIAAVVNIKWTESKNLEIKFTSNIYTLNSKIHLNLNSF